MTSVDEKTMTQQNRIGESIVLKYTAEATKFRNEAGKFRAEEAKFRAETEKIKLEINLLVLAGEEE